MKSRKVDEVGIANAHRCSSVLPKVLHMTISIVLRVRTFFHQAFQVYHVYCKFILDYICRITVSFGTLKDGSFLINSFASNISFSDTNMFQNGVNALSKIDDAF